MAQIIITREKSMIGMAAPMECYINNQVVCRVKNGESASCEVENGVIGFKCNLLYNPMSDEIFVDLSDGKVVNIKVKQGAWKPIINVIEKDAVVTKMSNSSGYVTQSKNAKTDLRKSLQDDQKLLNSGGNTVQVSAGTCFTSTREIGNHFAIDENASMLAIKKGAFPSLKTASFYKFEDIIDFELIEDGSSVVKGGIGRAIVGWTFFGGIGAIVGGMTGRKKIKQVCTSLEVRITLNNMATPIEYVKLISSTTNKSSVIYQGAYRDAQEIISVLQVICSRQNICAKKEKESPVQSDVVEEIRRYKGLMDEGIITEEEFLAKKKQLLGL